MKRRMRGWCGLTFAFLLGGGLSPLGAQEEALPTLRDASQPLAEVMVLGVFHFHNKKTIGENLRFLNEPANVLRAHEPYTVQASLGAGDGYVGARTVADWYERNLRIFANLAAITEPGDHVVLIIGAGHSPVLRHLVETHPGMKLVEAGDYLP